MTPAGRAYDFAIELGTALLLGLLLGYVLTGCGSSATDSARRALQISAVAIAESDSAVAVAYTRAADEALDEAGTAAEYDEAMRPWNEAERSLRVAYSALLTAESAIDAYEETGERDYHGALACALQAIGNVAGALRAIEIPIPVSVSRCIEMLIVLAEGGCRVEE